MQRLRAAVLMLALALILPLALPLSRPALANDFRPPAPVPSTRNDLKAGVPAGTAHTAPRDGLAGRKAVPSAQPVKAARPAKLLKPVETKAPASLQ